MLGTHIKSGVRWPAFIQIERAIAISKSPELNPDCGCLATQKPLRGRIAADCRADNSMKGQRAEAKVEQGAPNLDRVGISTPVIRGELDSKLGFSGWMARAPQPDTAHERLRVLSQDDGELVVLSRRDGRPMMERGQSLLRVFGCSLVWPVKRGTPRISVVSEKRGSIAGSEVANQESACFDLHSHDAVATPNGLPFSRAAFTWQV
jgi:hypothetical protein